MKLRHALFLMLFTAVSASGCVSARPQGPEGSSGGNRLTRTQLSSASSDNLYDAINKLRPEWLSSRGPTSVTDATPTSVSVFMNGNMLGKGDILKQVSLLDVTEVRYWEASQASARFGMGHPRGVIEIIRN
jgi:hypothetical protein